MSACILIVEDDLTSRETLEEALSDEGYTTLTAQDGETALKIMKENTVDLVITDLKMPGISGMSVLKECVAACPVILITAHGSVDHAVEAMKCGAFDFVTKPLNLPHLFALIERALEMRTLTQENTELKASLTPGGDFHGIIGRSPLMKQLYTQIEQVAPTDATVCIMGESGTGKELIADAIHHCSGRKDKPFIKVNCAAIAENLLESELFGHEKGSFTGAHSRRHGKFERADGGTLMLDEISEMAAPLQAKLLRILQEQSFERVGGSEQLDVDVRVIAATNADLHERIEEGSFREDLYYRITVFPLHVPPLRQRTDDIPYLVEYFIHSQSKAMNKTITGITSSALDMLCAHRWPGNVRELENTIARACVIASNDGKIDVEHIPALHGISSSASSASRGSLTSQLPNTTIDELERMAIEQALERFDGNKSQAAKSLGIGVKTLYRKLEKYSIPS